MNRLKGVLVVLLLPVWYGLVSKQATFQWMKCCNLQPSFESGFAVVLETVVVAIVAIVAGLLGGVRTSRRIVVLWALVTVAAIAMPWVW
jgi:hypothetical protein